MKRTTKTLTQRQKQDHIRRKAMPIALIQRPLRLIKNRTKVYRNSWHYAEARLFADMGNGVEVKRIARSLL